MREFNGNGVRSTVMLLLFAGFLAAMQRLQ
jgi:hypothetical protein